MLSCPKCGRHYAQGVTSCPEDGTPLRADETVYNYVACDPMVGQVLDEKYRLDERLGEGGMGTVYRATHLLIDRPVALKVLHTRFVEDDAAQERFRREARAAGRLRHPNAVAVTDFGRTSEGCVYIVMELLEGQTLRDVLLEEAPLAVEHAVALMSQIAAAVEAAHEGGVIHRDLKPGNIFVVVRKGLPPVVKVLDFGIAKLAAESLDDSDAKNLTQTGVMIGTPRYMSPEQCDGEKLTTASDVYSLGIIFYEMLTGETPFNGATPLAVALQHSSKPPRPPRELVPTLPPELERIVLHTLAKKPGDRPSDAGAFRDELLATARRLNLATPDPILAHAGALALSGSDANGNGKTPTGRLIISLEEAHESSPHGEGAGVVVNEGAGALNKGAGVAVKTGDTTMLADTAEQHRATGSTLATTTASEFVPARARAVTRFQIFLRGRPRWLYWLRQPPVLIALAITLLVIVSVAASLISTRQSGVATVGDANAAVSPAPSPAATPQPSPSVEEAANSRAVQGGREERRQEQRAQGRNVRKPAKGNRVVRTLKKIFRNPF
jgi:serine/threonine protein kinase